MSGLFSTPRFFFNDTPPTEIYTLSLHDALPISAPSQSSFKSLTCPSFFNRLSRAIEEHVSPCPLSVDRKSTRLNSSHMSISYAVFCLKKKKIQGRLRWTHHLSHLHRIKHGLATV